MNEKIKSTQAPASDSAQSQNLRVIIWVVVLGVCIWGYYVMRGPAMELIQKGLDRQSASFFVVSTLKSSLSVIEGSDVGVGFRLQVGDIVQSTYDLVDFTWKILLYGVLLITFSKLLYDSNLMDIGIYILGLGIALRIGALFWAGQKQRMTGVSTSIIIAGMITCFYIPISTIVSFHTSERFVAHIEVDLDRQLQEVTRDWNEFKSNWSVTKLGASVSNASEFIKQLFLKLTRVLITYTCLLVIRFLVFPLVVAYGFFVLSKAFLKRQFEQNIGA